MSYNPNDWEGYSELIACRHCGTQYGESYLFPTCAEQGCGAIGCMECLTECDLGVSCGRFCDEHIYKGECALCVLADLKARQTATGKQHAERAAA